MFEAIKTGVQAYVVAHWPLVAAVWGWLFLGVFLATWVAWDARRAPSRRKSRVAWLMPFVPPLAVVWLLFKHTPKPVTTPFGEPQIVDADGKPIPRSASQQRGKRGVPPGRMLLGGFAAGLFPGLGQLAYGRLLRTVVIWGLIAFSSFFVAAYLLEIERTWVIPDSLLPADKKGSDATVNFRVPGFFFLAVTVELIAFVAWAYIDAVGLGDSYAGEYVKQDDRFRRVFYTLSVQASGEDEAIRPVYKESFAVGSAERCDYRIEKEGVKPEHVVFYFHHEDDARMTLQFRCPTPSTDVLHNGQRSSSGVIRPGDGVELDDIRFLFRAL